MKIKFTLLFLLFFVFIVSGKEKYPETVSEAADILIQDIQDKDKEEIISKTKDDLIMYHFGWGTGIRNSFGLWKGNTKLLIDCGSEKIHPDDCSMIIIEEVWKKLRASYPKDKLNKIDRINEALNKIIISPYPNKNTGAIEYVKFLNSQIEKSPYSGEFVVSAACTAKHYRLDDFYNEKEQTLERALKYFEGQFLATITIKPDKILLIPQPFLNSEPCIP